MNKQQLKKLIKEVIRETDGMSSSSEKEKSSQTDKPDEKEKSSGDTMKHSVKHGEEYGDLHNAVATISLKGPAASNAHVVKDFLRQVAHLAKTKDLDAIHADLKKSGKSVVTMDKADLATGETDSPKAETRPSALRNLHPNFNFNNLTPEEQQQWLGKSATPQTLEYIKGSPPEEQIRFIDPNLPKDEKKKLYRLASIRPGEKEGEWKAATERDMEAERQKAKLRAAKLAAGTLETDPETGLPKDSSLWTDKEWDAYTRGGENLTYQDPNLKSAGKYKPSFKKSDRQTKGAVVHPVNPNNL